MRFDVIAEEHFSAERRNVVSHLVPDADKLNRRKAEIVCKAIPRLFRYDAAHRDFSFAGEEHRIRRFLVKNERRCGGSGSVGEKLAV